MVVSRVIGRKALLGLVLFVLLLLGASSVLAAEDGSISGALAGDDIVSGPLVLAPGHRFALSGNRLTIYGDLTVAGDFVVDTGTLVVRGNLLIDGGTLTMTKSAGHVDVHGALVADGADHTGKLTDGRITVRGDLLQLENHSPKSYNASGKHRTTLVGFNKLVRFCAPGQSAVKALTVSTGTTFTASARTVTLTRTYVEGENIRTESKRYATSGGSVLSLSTWLSSDINLRVPKVYLRPTATNGRRITIAGEAIIPAGSTVTMNGTLTATQLTVDGSMIVPTGAKVSVNGSLRVNGKMEQQGGAIDCGSFYGAKGSCSTMAGGSLALRGNFTQAAGSSFVAQNAHTTRSNGKGAKLLFADPDHNWFGAFGTGSGATFASGSALSIRGRLANNLNLGSDVNLALGGSLGGRQVSAAGAVTIPRDATLWLGTGRLTAGELTVHGYLHMLDSRGVVDVKGRYTACGKAASGSLLAGWLILEGDFVQRSDGSSQRNFYGAQAHKTVLVGSNHNITFEQPESNRFGTLIIAKGAVAQPETLPALSLQQVDSALADLQLSAGGQTVELSPAFSPDNANYTAIVPFAHPNVAFVVGTTAGQQVRCFVDGVLQSNWDGTAIAASGRDTVVELEIAACELPTGIDDPALHRCYTVTLRRAPLVTDIVLQSNGKIIKLSPAFDSSTTSYTADFPVDMENPTITFTATGELDVARIGTKKIVRSGVPIKITILPGVGANTRTLTLTAATATGQQAVYRIVLRRPLVTGLALSTGKIDGAFSPYRTTTVDIGYAKSFVKITPKVGSGVTIHDSAGAPLPGGAVTLKPKMGGTAKATLFARHKDGTQTITLVVRRAMSNNPALTSLGQSTGYLSPAFSGDQTDYTLTVPETATSLKLSPKAKVSNSTWRVGLGKTNTATSVKLPAIGGSRAVSVVVTAQDGTQRTYHVTVKRARTIVGITARPWWDGMPTLSPGGYNDLMLHYRLAQPASVKIAVRLGSGSYRTVKSVTHSTPGLKKWSWKGTIGGEFAKPGIYTFRVTPTVDGVAGTVRTRTVRVVDKPVFKLSSSDEFAADGSNTLKINASWSVLTGVTVRVVDSSGKCVRPLMSAPDSMPGSKVLYWDGRDKLGKLVPAGTYRIEISGGAGKTVAGSINLSRP